MKPKPRFKLKPGRDRKTALARAVDREKLRAALRSLHRDALLDVLDRAIDRIPDADLVEVAEEYFSLGELKSGGDLISEVKRFCKASLGGDYYESFDVNSNNFMEKSRGIETWIAECGRLFKRCAAEASKVDPAEARQAISSLLDLLRRVDEGGIEVVFWADEGGSWEVGVDWDLVLPVWLRCLAATAAPEKYAREALAAIRDFVAYDRKRYLKKARAAGTSAQRQALKSAGTSSD